jgi:Transposase DDE domain group 1
MTWACCAMAAWTSCSTRFGRPRRWARSCARSPTGTLRQLQSIGRRFTAALVEASPLLPGADELAFLDVDSKVKQVHGYAKQGAAFGYTKVRGLHLLAAAVSTPLAAPVIVATRLRKGSAGSGKSAASLLIEAIAAAGEAGATGELIARADSAFFSAKTIAAIGRAGARFSITVAATKKIRAAIDTITEGSWTPIRYPNAIYDDASGESISDAQITEVPFTAFTSKARKCHVTARLIVRRVTRPPTPVTAKANCSPSGATTRCSPTAASPSSRPRPSTAATPSSSRSSPTSTTARWPTYPAGRSTRTPPGSP